MKIIIEIKDTATLERIVAFGTNLGTECAGFDDVIKEISREW